MPDVRMPNGLVIRNVPEGMTRDQLLSKLTSSGYKEADLFGGKPAPAKATAPVAAPAAGNKPAESIAKWQGSIKQIDSEIDKLVAAGADDAEINSLLDQRNAYQSAIETTKPAAEYVARTGKPVPKMGAADIAVETLKAVPRGAIQSTAQVAGAAGILGKGGEKVAKAVEGVGEKAVEALRLKPSEAATINPVGVLTGNIGSGVGSIAPFMVAPAAGAPLRAANALRAARALEMGVQGALATGQGASESRQRIEKFEKETGQTVDPLRRQLAQAGGAAIGLSELMPLPGMLKKTPAGEIAETLTERLLKSAAEEGAQEGSSTLAQNVQGRLAYNPEQKIFEGVPEAAALGAIVGGGVRGVREGLGGVETEGVVPPPQAAPVAPDAAPIRRVTITRAADPEAADQSPVPVDLDVMTEPDVDGNQIVRLPTGETIAVPAASLPAPEPVVEPGVAPSGALEAAAPEIVEPAPISEPAVAAEPVPISEPGAVAPVDVTEAEPVAEPTVAPSPAALEAPAPTASEQPVTVPPRAVLPQGLSRAKPSYAFGDNRVELEFDNDIDKAIYIASSSTPSKARPKYLAWLAEQGVTDPEEIANIGQAIRSGIKADVRGGVDTSVPMRLPAYAAPVAEPSVLTEPLPTVAPSPELTPQPEVAPEPEPAPEPVLEPTPSPGLDVEETAPEDAQVFTPELAASLDTYDPALSKELVGKTVAQAVRHVGDRTPSQFYKALANRVSGMVDALERAGMKFTFSVAGERGGLNPDAPSNVRVALGKPGTAGVSVVRGMSDKGYFDTSVGVRGKPLPSAPKIGASESTLMHEVIHSVTQATIARSNAGRLPVGSRAEQAVKQLRALTFEIADGIGRLKGPIAATAERLRKYTNAFDSVDELVAWGLTSHEMQAVLKAIPVKDGGNAFTKFVRLVGKMLGFGEKDFNALRRLIEITEDLIPTETAAQEEIASNVVMPPEVQREHGLAPEEDIMAQPSLIAEQRQEAPAMELPVGDEKLFDRVRRIFQKRMLRLGYYENQIGAKTGETIPYAERPSEYASAYEPRTNTRLDDLQRDTFNKITDLMAKEDITPNEADLFLLARAAPARNAKIAERNPGVPDGGSGLTNAEAKAIIDNLMMSGRLPKLQKLGKLVDKMTRDTRNTLVEYGLISRDMADMLEATEPFYVPLKGRAKEGDTTAMEPFSDALTPVGTGFSLPSRELKVAKGRSTLPFSPLATAMADAQAAIIRGERNRVGQSFLNDIVRKYPSNVWTAYTQENPEVIQAFDRKNNRVVDRAVDMAGNADQYLVVKEDGEPVYIKIEDPLLMRAMTNGSSKEWGALTKAMVSTIGVATRMVSKLHTTLNPEFAVVNPLRDLQAAIFNILAEQDRVDGRLAGKEIVKGVMKDVSNPAEFKRLMKATFNHKATTTEQQEANALFQQAREDGAFTGWVQREDPQEHIEKIQKDLAKATATGGKKAWFSTVGGATKVMQGVMDFNSVLENTTRFAVYKRALEAGLSRQEAANMARSVTSDFNQKGELGPVVNALFAFFNASVQGNVQLIRSLTGRTADGKMTRAQKAALSIIALGAIQSALGYAMSDDDEDGKSFYEKIPAYEKERNLILMNPNGKDYLKIPLPYGYSFFHNLGAYGQEMATGQRSPGDFAGSMVSSLLGNFSPISATAENLKGVALNTVPTVLRPFADLVANQNFFGSEIYNEPFDREQAKSSVSRYSTPEGYKAVAEFLNEVSGGYGRIKGKLDVPAESLQYLVNQYVGGAGKFMFDTIDLGKKVAADRDVESRDVPILRKILGEPNSQADLGDYYDRINAIGPVERDLRDGDYKERAHIRKLKPVESDPTVISAKKSAMSAAKKINERKKRLMNADMDWAARDRAMDALNDELKSVYVRFNTAYNRVEKARKGE